MCIFHGCANQTSPPARGDGPHLSGCGADEQAGGQATDRRHRTAIRGDHRCRNRVSFRMGDGTRPRSRP